MLAASQVCWRWNYAATSPSSWESVSKRSIAFAYSRKAITSAYQGDWKGFFMEHRRLSTSLLMVIPNVNAVSLGSGGYFREQFQLDGLGWSVVLLVRALQPAGQLVSIRLLPNADNGAVSVSFTVRVLSSSAAGSTCSRAQHVFIDHTPLEVQLPLNSAQLSDPTRGFLGGDRIRVAVNVETLEQKVAKQAQELLSAMEKVRASLRPSARVRGDAVTRGGHATHVTHTLMHVRSCVSVSRVIRDSAACNGGVAQAAATHIHRRHTTRHTT